MVYGPWSVSSHSELRISLLDRAKYRLLDWMEARLLRMFQLYNPREEHFSISKNHWMSDLELWCYQIFLNVYLKKYLGKVKKSKISGEYYLTSLIDIAIKNNEKIEAVKAGKIAWRGINTPEELKEAERMFLQTK